MTMKSTIAAAALLGALAGTFCSAQTNSFPPDSKPSIWNSYGQQYPRVDSQLRGIFQLLAPEAGKVQLHLDKSYDMAKDSNGLWTVTTTPQAVGFHYYWFVVDGVNVADPASDSFFGVGRQYSGIEIPSAGEDFYDIKDVPHGEIRGHWYHSDITHSWRRCFVYTPPGYDTSTDRYPVLYLLHGAGEDQSGWGWQGRANFILDNLIAEGKAKAMILVMDNGGGNSFGGGRGGFGGGRGPGGTNNGPAGMRGTNAPGARAGGRGMGGGFGGLGGGDFGKIMTTEIIPMIDASYRTLADQPHRAIAGLSMGSMQAVSIGMANLDKFSSIGSFSGASLGDPSNTNSPVSRPAEFNRQVKVAFASFGSVEPGSKRLATDHDALVAAGITNSHYYISPGTAHEWETWRRSLHEMAPLLFQE
jgi:enterochelin esterase family protein